MPARRMASTPTTAPATARKRRKRPGKERIPGLKKYKVWPGSSPHTGVVERGAWAPRSLWNLHQLLPLLGGERRGNELPRHGVGHDLIDALDPAGGEIFLR